MADSASEAAHVVHLLFTTAAKGTAQSRIVAALGRSLDRGAFRVEAWVLGDIGPLDDDLREAGIVVRHVPFGVGRTCAGGCASVGRFFARAPTSFTSTSEGARLHGSCAASQAQSS